MNIGPIKSMALSPDGKHLALFTAEGNLEVVSSDFQHNVCKFVTKSSVAPKQLVWYALFVILFSLLTRATGAAATRCCSTGTRLF